MDFAKVLNRYANARRDRPPTGVEHDFDTVVKQVPPADFEDGLAEAFRADETPPFEEMVAELYGRSDPETRAGLLDNILPNLGGGLAEKLRNMTAGGRVAPNRTTELDPQQVQEMAREARASNPNILERVSQFYAKHPDLVRNLGGIAMGIALNRMASRRRH